MASLRSLHLAALLSLIPATAMIPACGGNSGQTDGSANTDALAPGDSGTYTNQYAGSALYGDVVTFGFDPIGHTYTVNNETTNTSASGSYTVMLNELAGLYKVQVGTDKFYAIELTDRLIAANFPTGNPGNTISFGLTTKNAANWQTHFAGDYSYIMISNEPVNGSTANKEWGVVSIAGDGTFKVRMLGTSGTGSHPAVAPEDFTQQMMPATNPSLTGLWQEDANHPGRLVITIDQQAGQTRAGFVYADGDQAAFMIDNGPGKGFILAFKLSNITLAETAGSYKFINVFNNDTDTGRSAGMITVNSNGTGSGAHLDQNDNVTSTTLENMTQCPVLKNMFYANITETDGTNITTEKLYWVITGRFIMAFGFRTDHGPFRFSSYAAGARLN